MYRFLFLVTLMLGTVIPNKHALHMFQQNRYEFGRYSKWMKDQFQSVVFKDVKLFFVFYLVVLCTAFIKAEYLFVAMMVMSILFFVCTYSKERKKEYIKPLVYTARVKRQIVFLYGLELLTILFIPMKSTIAFSLSFLVLISGWLMIYPMGVATMPLESFVKKWYLNDAKRQLNEHTNLIKIGITGSYGKTTTKNVMNAVLSQQFQTLITPASYNTPMGITRTIREYLQPIDQVFVCEMGADHVHDITELMEFVHPNIGVVTSIGPQHLQTFGSLENIIHEKMQMIEMLPEDGFGVLNYDNQYIREYKRKNPVHCVSYGIENLDADYTAQNIQYTRKGTSFDVCYGDEVVHFETKLLGQLNILNILSAIAVARHLNVSWEVIMRGVKNMQQVEHRLERKIINGYTFIDDAFNANPSGSKMALDVLAMMEGHRYIVTPGMIDLGEIQEKVNYEFGQYMMNRADTVILVGPKQTKPIYDGLKDSGFDLQNVIVVENVKEAFAILYQNANYEDTILLENDLPDAFSN